MQELYCIETLARVDVICLDKTGTITEGAMELVRVEPSDGIDLDRLTESAGAKEMSNEYLATLLDYGAPVVYSDLETYETTEEGVKEKRVIAYDTVMGKSENTHTLRLWIDEESPVSEQGSTSAHPCSCTSQIS